MANTKTKAGAPKKSGAPSASKKSAASGAVKKVASGNSTRSPLSGVATGNTQLEKFFEDALKDIYWAEKALTKALGELQEACTTAQLRSAIETHIDQTDEHVSRLEEVFQLLGKKPQAKKCEAMAGLIKEGETAVEETEDGSMTRDAAIIVACQKVEHYEIATYGSLVHLASIMANEEVSSILQVTLDEEKETDEILTDIAENNINWEAEQESSKE